MFNYKAALAAGVALVLSSVAYADSIEDYVHLELGIGVSRYTAQSDGTWYQQGAWHHMQLSAPVLTAGFTGPIFTRESWGVDWHADYVNLGHVSEQCECTSVDANYDTATHQKINTYDLPNAKFVGNGNAQGIALTLEPYFRYRGWRFGVDGGLFPYRPSWDDVVYNTQDGVGVAPHTIDYQTPHGIQLGKVIGVSVGRGPFTVAYQHYFLPSKFDSTHSPAGWRGADAVTLNYRF